MPLCNIQVQHFTIAVPRHTPFRDARLVTGVFCDGANDSIILSTEGMSSISHFYHNPDSEISVFIIGSPIVNAEVDREAAAHILTQNNDRTLAIRALDGEFLAVIIDQRQQAVDVFTDRFSSYPFFWAENQQCLFGSYNYTDLARACRNWSGFALRPAKAYEFFKLQRLMGEETHDTLSRCLPSAGHLHIKGNHAPRVKRYWQQNYEKTSLPPKILAEQFSSLLKASVNQRRDGCNQSTGVFLSGGHDSRMIACHMGENTTCYTLGFSDNFEVDCARRIAHTLGQRHVLILLPDDYFMQSLDTATYLSGGLYANDHALFIPPDGHTGYESVLLHGHGLDYMFQGMYLHAKPRMILGRPTYIKRPTPFPYDLSQHFIDKISFRLKFMFESEFGVPSHIQNYQRNLYESVHAIETQGRTLTDNPSSLWEYFIFHQPSRHYTFTNILSKRLCGEVRTPSFDNQLYDFYMALPDRYRLHADMMRAALYAANPEVAEIPAGNHGISAGWGPYRKTAALMQRKILRHLTSNRKFYAPSGTDRTWPDRNTYLKQHESYWQAALAPLHDSHFQDFLNFIDWKTLKTQPETLLQQEFGGAFWVSMLSYYRFYKFVYCG